MDAAKAVHVLRERLGAWLAPDELAELNAAFARLG